LSTATKRIVLAQIAPGLGMLKENIERHLEIVSDARKKKADVVVFPELSLTGYQLKDLVADVALMQGEVLDLFKLLGEGKSIEVVLGYMERSTGFQYYNAMAHIVINSSGRVRLLHNHRKINLPTYGMFEEQRYYSQGKNLNAYNSTSIGRCGMLVCEDFWHPANTLLLSLDSQGLEGVKAVFVGANSPARGVTAGNTEPANSTTWKLMARHTAMVCNCLVVICHRVGVEDGFVFVGGSEILAPGGKEICRAPLFEENILTCDIQVDALVREGRIMFPGGSIDDYELLERELDRIRKDHLTGEQK